VLAPLSFLVPELDALYVSIIAAQIHWARGAAGVDSLPKLQLFILAIAEEHRNSLE
jgi:hypothetical protein